MPAPTSCTCAAVDTAVKVLLPLLRYRLLRPKSLTTYRSGGVGTVSSLSVFRASYQAQLKLYRSFSAFSPAASVRSRNVPSPWLCMRKLGGPFRASK